MKISIITVCYNSARDIRAALESVAAQKGAEIEHIVIDGGSTDGTVDRIREFESEWSARFRAASPAMAFRWISEPDDGMYDALNKGMRMATGEIVGILNADDRLDGDDVLARVSAAFAATPELDCRFGNVRFVRDSGGRTQRVCFARFWRPWMLHWGYMPPHPAIFIRKACFARWGMYVPSRREYRIAADYELLVRFFCRNRMSYRYMPICTTAMRLGGVSTKDVEARKKLNEEIVKANRTNGYFCCFPMLLPKYFVKIWEVILPRMGLLR